MIALFASFGSEVTAVIVGGVVVGMVVAFGRWSWRGIVNQVIDDLEMRMLPDQTEAMSNMIAAAIAPVMNELRSEHGRSLKEEVAHLSDRVAVVELEVRNIQHQLEGGSS